MTEAIEKKYYNSIKKFPFGSQGTIRKLIKDEAMVLDVGCASGYLGKGLSGTFFGIDANVKALKKAAETYKQVALVDLNNLPKKQVFKEKFDVIVFADVLEHVLEPELVLAHFKGYLKKNGRIIVSLPNVALWRVRLNLLLGRFDYTDYGVLDRTHLHLYTYKSARELVERSGYRYARSFGAANALGWLVLHIPALRPLLSIHVIIEAISK